MNLKTIIARLITSLALLGGLFAAAPSYAETLEPTEVTHYGKTASASAYTLTSGFLDRKGREFMTGMRSLLLGDRLHLSDMPMGLADAIYVQPADEHGPASGVVGQKRYFAYKTDMFGLKMAYDLKYSNAKDRSSGIEPLDILTLLPGSASDKHIIMAELKIAI